MAAAPDVQIATTLPDALQGAAEFEAFQTLCRDAVAAAWRAAAEPRVGGSIEVALVDDGEAARLNERFRNRAGPTNVLSFAYDHDAPDHDAPGEKAAAPDAPFGEIVIAFETAAAEARAEERPLPDHLARLVVHGTLHLFGYDHETPDEAAEMEALEARALAAIGAADPHAPLLTGSDEPHRIR